jgi:PAS domain S-box-containing protein
MSDDAATAERSSSEAVEELLRQLVDARFVLTDREGTVTRWGRPAEDLFGWPGAAMLGRSLVRTLDLPDALPADGGRLTTVARRKDGHELEVALALVPVGMSLSLEFNGFLEALEIAAPRGDALSRLGRSHRAVVDWIEAALDGRARLEEDGLGAGTIIAFRALDEPPAAPSPHESGARPDTEGPGAAYIELALEDNRQVLAEMGAEVERLRAELGQTHEKLSTLETAMSQEQGLAEWVDEVHGRLASVESALAEAPGAEGLEELRGELGALRAGELERSGEEAELRLLADQVKASAETAQQARAGLEQLAERAAGAAEAAQSHSSTALGAAREAESVAKRAEEHAARSSDSAGSAAEDQARLLEASAAAEGHAQRAHESTQAVEGHAQRAAEQAGRAEALVRRMTEAADAAERRAAEALQAASSAARAAEVARRSAREAGADAAAMRGGAAHARGYEAPAPLARFRGHEGAANGGAAAERDVPRRPSRQGFDDTQRPMATTDLNGHFRELNQAFCDLVGYSEEEFKAAVWPPVMDRPNLPRHREQMEQLLQGRIDSAEFNTGYLHAQGLMVPLAGTITLVAEDGNPGHFLLAVDA